jgi:hydrogenase-4 membrane subunit HyfE
MSWAGLFIAILTMIISLQLYDKGSLILSFLVFFMSGILVGQWVFEGFYNSVLKIGEQSIMFNRKLLDELTKMLDEKKEKLELTKKLNKIKKQLKPKKLKKQK